MTGEKQESARAANLRERQSVSENGGGRIISMGTHAELMDRCELYARLAALQFDPDLTLENLTAARNAVG